MSWVLILIVIIGILIIAALGILLYNSLNKEDEDFMDYTIIEVYPTMYTHNHSDGVLIDVIKGPERDGFVFIPKDVDYLRKLKKNQKLTIEPEVIFAPLSCVVPLPRGTLSGERNKIKIFPESPEDLPRQFLETAYGKATALYIAQVKAETTAIDIIRHERNVEDEVLKMVKGHDLIRMYLKTDKALKHDWAESILSRSEPKKLQQSQYTPQSNQNLNPGGY